MYQVVQNPAAGAGQTAGQTSDECAKDFVCGGAYFIQNGIKITCVAACGRAIDFSGNKETRS